MILTTQQRTLLHLIMNNVKCFDKKDNTFKLSNRAIASKIHTSRESINRLMRLLKSHDLIHDVIISRISDKRVSMLSPKFMYINYDTTNRFYIGALYYLRDIKAADSWRDLCKDLSCFVDYETGEMKPFNWYPIDKAAQKSSCFDRTYRSGYSEMDEEPQKYRLDELKEKPGTQITDYDKQWFDSINKHSEYIYRRHGYKVERVNVYNVKLYLFDWSDLPEACKMYMKQRSL